MTLEASTPSIDRHLKKTRPFHLKLWAYFKQSNPLLNTWRYYLRLHPRWIRSLIVLNSGHANFLLLLYLPLSPLNSILLSSSIVYFVILFGLYKLLSTKITSTLTESKS